MRNYASPNPIDSLKNVIATTTNDSIKIMAYVSLVYNNISTPVNALEIISEMKELSGKIKKLHDDTVFYPGHDYGSSTHAQLGMEKKTNPFLLANSVEDFLHLVRH